MPKNLTDFTFYLYFCNVHTFALVQMGEDNDILRSVIDALFLTV
ncbi:hypothetical protein SAMN05216462_2773 [Xylanibacter ruminicola]|uniref:Uncharacterized protein n=1 Tax=Xylanibacter ruminicola TaxID=839 RepID=A0A1H4EFC3_XYLRU|nr:hypothetical protein SAMN05216462_2773 [Xylanibacter ruminicola]